MPAKNLQGSPSLKRCRLCQNVFSPDPKVGQRQWACSRPECQTLRQKLNHIDWLERNPVDYKKWYQDYGKAWRQKNPDYQRNYRKHKKVKPGNDTPTARRSQSNQVLLSLLRMCHDEKKEQLTQAKTANKDNLYHEKKEQLGPCFYLLKAERLAFLPLHIEKKEQLSSCFT